MAIGAASYGVLTTFVKMAYAEGFTFAEVTFSQMFLGFLLVFILNFFYKGTPSSGKTALKPTKKNIRNLLLAGIPLGLTSVFYYASVQYVSVSVGIVLLMQSVWMGIVLDAVVEKKFPSFLKLCAAAVILFGTLLATNIFLEQAQIDVRGLGFGLLAALSYTFTIYVSNRVANHLPPVLRSKWILFGGVLMVGTISLPSLLTGFNFEIFYKWGPILAVFGAVLPPILFTAGMPKIKVGLGAIISSLELPVAVLMAYFLLNESVNSYQWAGIVLILISVVAMNLPRSQA